MLFVFAHAQECVKCLVFAYARVCVCESVNEFYSSCQCKVVMAFCVCECLYKRLCEEQLEFQTDTARSTLWEVRRFSFPQDRPV